MSAKVTTLALIPEGVPFKEAAAVPLAAMTAWQAMAPSMPLAGKRVLVHAGAGGVGSFGVQVSGERLGGCARMHGLPHDGRALMGGVGAACYLQ